MSASTSATANSHPTYSYTTNTSAHQADTDYHQYLSATSTMHPYACASNLDNSCKRSSSNISSSLHNPSNLAPFPLEEATSLHQTMQITPSLPLVCGRYAVLKRLGAGTFGEIVHAIDLKTRKQYALKSIKPSLTHVPSLSRLQSVFLNEGNCIKQLNALPTSHPGKQHIIRCLRTLHLPPVISQSHPTPISLPCLVLELCQDSLLSFMLAHANAQRGIAPRVIHGITSQLLCAMSFLHGLGQLIHCDIKPENILVMHSSPPSLSSSGCSCAELMSGKAIRIKLVDFGNAIRIKHSIQSFDIQTLLYRSPEMLMGNYQELSTQIDMWSVGCVLYELMFVSAHQAYDRLFATHKLGIYDVLFRICQQTGPLPRYVYNEYKSVHWHNDLDTLTTALPFTLFDEERSYVVCKARRFNKICRLVKVDADSSEEMIALADLLTGLLDPNPVTRLSSEDGLRHRFVSGDSGATVGKCNVGVGISDDMARQGRVDMQMLTWRNMVACGPRQYTLSSSSIAQQRLW